MSNHWLGVDTGGTFTDFVYFDGVSIRIHKVLSTPHAPEQAILQGIDELRIACTDLQLIHGSTVATNAVLEGKGVKTAYVTNLGFADVLQIGRQARRELYNLSPEPRPPLIPTEYCLELDTRLSSTGNLLRPLLQADLEALIEKIKQLKPRAIAINLLFSFLDNSQEKQIKNLLQKTFPDLFICCSSDVLPEHKEYERGMATALNAYVGPLMQGYLKRLLGQLGRRSEDKAQAPALSVLQSSGGTISAAHAAEQAVNLLLSGPAGGLKAVQFVAELAGEAKLMSFDMGGTSTDVALMDGQIHLSSELDIGDYPVAVPMVDMHTIGAGGGSIAFVDGGGLLNVGPQSAGANPGPACYGLGGKLPTVTDANLVLGRLRADGFLGQEMLLDSQAAEAAIRPLAKALGLSNEAAAEGIIDIANEHMARALRAISVQRGFDPQDFSLACFGGAGGLHVCALAKALGMSKAIVPIYGGVLSALGMLVAAPSRELSHSCIEALERSDVKRLEHQFLKLESKGVEDMQQELNSPPELQRSLDLRYKGQSFTLNVALSDLHDIDRVQRDFHDLHKKTYGHELDMPVELVNLRVSIQGKAAPFCLPRISSEPEEVEVIEVACYGFGQAVMVYQRDKLYRGQIINGPAIILETVSTTLIEEQWRCEVDDWGNLLLSRC